MSLSKSGLKSEILSEMEALGFVTGAYSRFHILAEAIANAVVDHITGNALVTTTSGAPDGEHTGGVS